MFEKYGWMQIDDNTWTKGKARMRSTANALVINDGDKIRTFKYVDAEKMVSESLVDFTQFPVHTIKDLRKPMRKVRIPPKFFYTDFRGMSEIGGKK